MTRKENWRNVKGHEKKYQVSDLGRVKSLPRMIVRSIIGNSERKIIQPLRGRILKPQKHPGGYLMVTLSKKAKIRSYLIHRLVAQAFIPNPKNKKEINHKDCDKKNNERSNLQWVTKVEHDFHTKCNGLRLGRPAKIKEKTK